MDLLWKSAFRDIEVVSLIYYEDVEDLRGPRDDQKLFAQ